MTIASFFIELSSTGERKGRLLFQEAPQSLIEVLLIDIHQFAFLIVEGVYHDLDAPAIQVPVPGENVHILDTAEEIRIVEPAPATGPPAEPPPAQPPAVEDKLIDPLGQTRKRPHVPGKPDARDPIFPAKPAHQRGDSPLRMDMVMRIQVGRVDARVDHSLELCLHFFIYRMFFLTAQMEHGSLPVVNKTAIVVAKKRAIQDEAG